MIDAEDTQVWIKEDTKEVRVAHRSQARRYLEWDDPIGASYSCWGNATDDERVRLMLETAIEYAIKGFSIKDILREFSQVREFRALGMESYPMARALLLALTGKALEPNSLSFEEMLEREHVG